MYTSRKVKSVLLIPPEIEEGTPHWVRADRSRMCQIVGNLLSNSCKFTLNGSIGANITTEKMNAERTQGNLLITVKVRDFYFFFGVFGISHFSFNTGHRMWDPQRRTNEIVSVIHTNRRRSTK